jgi:hypothetical protein
VPRTAAAKMKDWLLAAYDAAFNIEKLVDADGRLKSSVYNPSLPNEGDAQRAVSHNYTTNSCSRRSRCKTELISFFININHLLLRRFE